MQKTISMGELLAIQNSVYRSLISNACDGWKDEVLNRNVSLSDLRQVQALFESEVDAFCMAYHGFLRQLEIQGIVTYDEVRNLGIQAYEIKERAVDKVRDAYEMRREEVVGRELGCVFCLDDFR